MPGPLIRGVETDGKTQFVPSGSVCAAEMADTQMSSTLKAAVTLGKQCGCSERASATGIVLDAIRVLRLDSRRA